MGSRVRALEDYPLPRTAQHVTPLLCATPPCTAPLCPAQHCAVQHNSRLSSPQWSSAVQCSLLFCSNLDCSVVLCCTALHARLHQTDDRYSNMIKARRSGTCRGRSEGGGRGGGRMQPWPAAYILNLND